jgi:hypothetical protein
MEIAFLANSNHNAEFARIGAARVRNWFHSFVEGTEGFTTKRTPILTMGSDFTSQHLEQSQR